LPTLLSLSLSEDDEELDTHREKQQTEKNTVYHVTSCIIYW